MGVLIYFLDNSKWYTSYHTIDHQPSLLIITFYSYCYSSQALMPIPKSVFSSFEQLEARLTSFRLQRTSSSSTSWSGIPCSSSLSSKNPSFYSFSALLLATYSSSVSDSSSWGSLSRYSWSRAAILRVQMMEKCVNFFFLWFRLGGSGVQVAGSAFLKLWRMRKGAAEWSLLGSNFMRQNYRSAYVMEGLLRKSCYKRKIVLNDRLALNYTFFCLVERQGP